VLSPISHKVSWISQLPIALAHSDLGSANRILTDITSAHPDTIFIQYQLAEVLRNQEDFQGAITHYERITRAWPEWTDPWLGLSLCYGSLGRLTESHLARAQGYLVAPDKESAKQSLAIAKEYLRKTPNPALTDWANALQSRIDALK
jgi:predicted Zn-dependent protease